MKSLGDLFEEWRQAHRAALAMEREVVRASMGAKPGDSDEALQEAQRKARELRERAHDLLDITMGEMKRVLGRTMV